MTTLPLPPSRGSVQLSSRTDTASPESRKLLLLVFTEDEAFWQRLRRAATTAARQLVRRRKLNCSERILLRLKPGAVLLDLEAPLAWDTADSLLQIAEAPPLLLLTSRSEQHDFKCAIEAGFLINKKADPALLLALAQKAMNPATEDGQQNARQRLVVRWLKPFGDPVGSEASHRFLSFNE